MKTPNVQENKLILQIFCRWLKLNNLFPIWKRNVIQQNCLPYIKSVSLRLNKNNLIDGSFKWMCTEQGCEFWSEQNDYWRLFYNRRILKHFQSNKQ